MTALINPNETSRSNEIYQRIADVIRSGITRNECNYQARAVHEVDALISHVFIDSVDLAFFLLTLLYEVIISSRSSALNIVFSLKFE